jgi:hypothetical protein
MPYSVKIALLFVLTVILGGCASSGGSLVVLSPDLDGKTGGITVANQAGSVTVDSPYQASKISSRTEPPNPPFIMSKQEVETLFSDALSIQPKPPVHYILYFEKDLQLTLDSLKLFPEIINAIKERTSIDISVVGHTDSVGSMEYNMTLSQNRANSVRDLLVQKGIDSSYIKTTSHGKENPLIKTEDNVSEPRNRRVEVVVR